MKIPIKTSWLIWLITCSWLIEKVLYSSYHTDNIFAIFIHGVLGLIWLLLFYQIFRKEQKTSATKSKLTAYWTSIVSVLTLAPLIVTFGYYENKLNVPTLIKAQRHGVSADFKTDGTYIIKSGPWASRIHFYGRYILRDSIIQIDPVKPDEVLIADRFLIKHTTADMERHRPDYDRLTTETYLVQIDKEGKEIKTRNLGREILPYKFAVVVDKRR